MRLGGKKTKAALVVLLLAGLAAYPAGRYLWSRHLYHVAEEALRRRDFSEANLHLKKYLAIWPGDLSALLLEARTARRQGNYEEAEQLLQACQRKGGPREPLALEYTLLRMQQWDLNEAHSYLAFCSDHPESPEMPLILEALIEGILKALEPAFAQGQAAEGGAAVPNVAWLQRAIDLWLRYRLNQADQVQGLVWRSQAHAFANDYPKALADVRKALQLDPDHFQARMQLAQSVAQEAPREAAALFESLLRRQPENNRVRFALASVRRGLGQLEEARKILDEMLASRPDSFSVLVERGKLAIDQEQLQDAERWLRQALALAPNEPELNRTLSHCLRLAGKDAEAKFYHDKFREFDARRKRQQDETVQKSKPAPGG